jgi:hypothetical protein
VCCSARSTCIIGWMKLRHAKQYKSCAFRIGKPIGEFVAAILDSSVLIGSTSRGIAPELSTSPLHPTAVAALLPDSGEFASNVISSVAGVALDD